MTTFTNALNTTINLMVPGMDLDLTVSNQEGANRLVDAARSQIAARSNSFKEARQGLATRQREALYEDLATALSVAQVLLDPSNEEYLDRLLDEHGIPIVLDPETRNAYVQITRLLWGYYPKATKENPYPKFTWSRSVELYGAVLRGAVLRGVMPHNLAAKLKEEKGFRKFKIKDKKKYQKTDLDLQDMDARRKLVTKDDAIGTLPPRLVTVTSDEKKECQLISLLGRVMEDGSVEIIRRLPASQSVLLGAIDRLSDDVISEIRERKNMQQEVA